LSLHANATAASMIVSGEARRIAHCQDSHAFRFPTFLLGGYSRQNRSKSSL
jgi:hypothetical protein